MRWQHRKEFLSSVVLASMYKRLPLAAPVIPGISRHIGSVHGVDEDVVSLLRDHRLVRHSGRVMASVVSGMVTRFLSECCEWRSCPWNAPVLCE